MENINIDKSLNKKRLILKSEYMEIFDMIVFLFVVIGYTAVFMFTFVYDGLIRDNLKITGLIFYPLFLIFIIILTIQKFRDKRFIKIETGHSQNDNHKLIKDYIKKQSWTIGYDNENYIRASIPFTWTWGKEITIIFKGNEILINVLRKNPFVRMPTFFTDKEIVNDIKVLINASI